MLSLPELQRRFAANLFGEPGVPLTPWIHPDGIAVDLRLGIYRHNLQEGFAKTLALEFPVIQRLVGEQYFRQLAMSFLASHPSRSGDLHHIGEPFSMFLRRLFAATPHGYFADVAALEWAWQECLVARDDAALEPPALQAVPSHAYPQLRFTLRHSARLLESAFPVLRIWEINQSESASEEIVDLASGPDFVLVHRAAAGATVTRVAAGEFVWLSNLAAGQPLEAALDAALVREPTFDLSAALRHGFEIGAFARLSVPSDGI